MAEYPAIREDINWDAFVTAPFRQQKEFISQCLNPRRQYVAAISGLQGGKTLSGADALYQMLYGPDPLMLPEQIRQMPMDVWVVSKSYALVDVALMTFRARTPSDIWLNEKARKRWNLKTGDPRTYWLKPNVVGLPPIRLRARTASDPESFRATPTLGVAWADEIAHWKEMAWNNLQGRAIVVGSRFIITTTPAGRNWLYRDIYQPGINGTDASISVHTWTSADNPYADKKYIDKLRVKFGPDYAQQELDAMFTTNVGYVYDFDRTVHMKQPIPSEDPDDYAERVVGIDPGYSDPYAAVLCLKDFDGHWWIADEMYFQSKATVEEVYPKLKYWHTKWKVRSFYVDKRRPTDHVLLRRKGLPAVPNIDIFGENTKRTVMPMIRIVQRVMREGRFHLAPHCEWTAEEFEHYSFKTNEEKNAGENPIDFSNHALDALRYAIAAVDALPEDRRPRYRRGPDGVPVPIPGSQKRRPGDPLYTIPTVAETLAAQDAKMENRNKWGVRRSQDRHRQLRSGRRLGTWN